MKLLIAKLVEGFFEDHSPSELDHISIKDCLHYTSYGFFIAAMISLFQGDTGYAVVPLLIAIFLKL